jgi:hypothetical protein
MRTTGRRLAVAALLLATAVAAQAQCKFMRIAMLPIEWRDDRLTLDGSVNGTPLRITVDTGAMQTLVSGELSERLKLTPAHVNNASVGVGGRSEMSMARLDEFSLGRIQWNRMKVAIVWQAKGLPDVLVGAPLLFGRDVEFTDKAIVYYSAEGCDDAPLGYWGDDVSWLPMASSANDDPRVYVTVSVNGVPVRALVDSGAPARLPSRGSGAGRGQPARYRRAREPGEQMILGADLIRAHHLLFANSQRPSRRTTGVRAERRAPRYPAGGVCHASRGTIRIVERARPSLVHRPKGCTGGRSGLHRAAQQVTPARREPQGSRRGSEQQRRADSVRVKRAISACSNIK